MFYNICSIKRYVFSLPNIALFSHVSFYKNKFNKIIVNRLDDAQINDIILSIIKTGGNLMAKKSSKSVVNQIICYALILAALLGIVTIILIAEGTYFEEGIWCGLATTLVLALAGAWYGWNNAKLPGVGGKVAYILTVLIILATILFVPLYIHA